MSNAPLTPGYPAADGLVATPWTAMTGEMMGLSAATPWTAKSSEYYKLFAAGLSADGAGDDVKAPADPYTQSLWPYKLISKIATTLSGIPAMLLAANDDIRLSRSKGLVIRRRDAAAATGQPSASTERAAGRTLAVMRGCRRVLVGRAVDGEVVESGPAYDLLEQPNSYDSLPSLIKRSAICYLRSGAVAWILDLSDRRRPAWHAVDGRLVKPVVRYPASGLPYLDGYIYRHPKTRAEMPLLPDEVCWCGIWDGSDDPLSFMPPSRPGRLTLSTDHAAKLYNASALTHGSDPGLVVSMPGSPTDEQRDRYIAMLRQRHAQPANARKPLLVWGGTQVDSFASSFADLQFQEGQRTGRLEHAALYDVPPVVAGFLEAAGDSSAYAGAAMRQYLSESILPLLDLFAPHLQAIVDRVQSGLAFAWHIEDHPVLMEMRLARMPAVDSLWAKGVPLADINDMLALGLPDREEYAVGYLPVGVMPASDVAAGNTFAPIDEPAGDRPDSDDPVNDPVNEPANHLADPDGAAGNDPVPPSSRGKAAPLSKADEALARRSWQAWAASWQPLLRHTARSLRSAAVRQERRLREALGRYVLDAEAGKQAGAAVAKDAQRVQALLAEVFDDAEQRRLRVRFAQISRDAQELGLRQALIEAGLSGDALEEAMRRLLAHPRIEELVRREAYRQSRLVTGRTRQLLRRHLAEGLAGGEDLRKLADRVQSVMGGRRRAAVSTASNAVGGILSRARHEGHESAGLSYKYWLHSRGPGERRVGHIAAEARYRAHPIPLQQRFEIGQARLMYPRDFAANAPAETVNCQCVQVAVRDPAQARAAASGAAGWAEALPTRWCSYAEMLDARAAREADATTRTPDTTGDAGDGS